MHKRIRSAVNRSSWLGLANAIAFLVPAGLLAGALLFEHVGGLKPCEMCMMQRWPHVAAVAIAAMAPLVAPMWARRGVIMSAAGAIGVSGIVAIDHLGVERKWWEGHTACTSSLPTGLSTSEYLDAMMKMPLIRCDTPQWTMMGLSLADMNAIASTATAIIVAWMVVRSRKVSRDVAADAA
jgi:disulfide bond formation protein DsbB